MPALISTLIAYAGAIIFFYLINNYSPLQKNTDVHIFNTRQEETGDLALCWSNPDDPLSTYVEDVTRSCNRLNGGVMMNTFVGHKFGVARWEEKTVITPQYFFINPDDMNYDLSNPETFKRKQILSIYEYWQMMLTNRKRLAFVFGLILLIYLLISKEQSSSNSRPSNRSTNSLLIPRHDVKAYAVIVMVLNHIGHYFFSGSSKAILVLPADAGGAIHIFCWLVGYNLSKDKKSSNILLVIVYLVMMILCRLPAPLYFETLLNITLIRIILNLPIFEVNEKLSCKFADYSIILHMLAIIFILICTMLFGNEGLSICYPPGFFSAISGRLFAMKSEKAKTFLWLLMATLQNCMHVQFTSRALDMASYFNLSYIIMIYGSMLGLTLLFIVPKTKWVLWKDSSKVAKFLSKYSLEIYVIHFAILKVIHIYETYN